MPKVKCLAIVTKISLLNHDTRLLKPTFKWHDKRATASWTMPSFLDKANATDNTREIHKIQMEWVHMIKTTAAASASFSTGKLRTLQQKEQQSSHSSCAWLIHIIHLTFYDFDLFDRTLVYKQVLNVESAFFTYLSTSLDPWALRVVN